jgi:hypothetical protein
MWYHVLQPSQATPSVSSVTGSSHIPHFQLQSLTMAAVRGVPLGGEGVSIGSWFMALFAGHVSFRHVSFRHVSCVLLLSVFSGGIALFTSVSFGVFLSVISACSMLFLSGDCIVVAALGIVSGLNRLKAPALLLLLTDFC